MKLVFDHVRNVIICGAMLTAGIWTATRLDSLYYAACGGLLIAASAVLYLANLLHGMRHLRDDGVPGWLFTWISWIHAAVFVSLAFFPIASIRT